MQRSEGVWVVMLARLALMTCAFGLLSAVAGSTAPLVATRTLSPVSYEVSLPQKVGVLLARDHQWLAFEVSGRLAFIVEEGQRVSRGEVIARLEDGLERAELQRADLLLGDARRELERLERLRSSRVASEKSLEDARTAVALRGAERDAARERLGRKGLIALWEGVLAEHLLELGEIVSPATPVATVMNLDSVRIEIGVPGYQLGQIATGQRAVVTIPALESERFEGRVRSIAPAAAQGTHFFEVEIDVPNPEGRLRPGLTARVEIITDTLQNVIVVPLESVVEREGERVIFFVSEGRATRLGVARARVHRDVLLLPGSIPHRELILKGQHDLHDGDPVRVDDSVLRTARQP